jgi:glycosyltransferase involved in cell wall biosynthesis
MSRTRAVLQCIATLEGGGAERQLCYLAQHLVRKGWCVHVVILREGVNLERLQRSGAQIHKIDAASNYEVSIVGKLVKIIRVVNPVVVQCWQHPMDFYGALASLIARKPFMTMERTSPSKYASSWRSAVRFAIAQVSAAIVSNSSEGQRFWGRRLRSGIPNVVIPNIVPFEELTEQGFATDKPANSIVAVGRLSAEKNLPTLLEAIKLAAANVALTLDVVGEGPERDRIVEFIASNGLASTVVLRGYQTDVWAWMRRATVVVSLSLYEGMPNAVLEAAALRVPLLLSDIPAHREHFDDESAYFVDPTDARQVADSLLEMLNEPLQAQRKAARAFEAIKGNGGDAIAARYLELYDRLAPRAAG